MPVRNVQPRPTPSSLPRSHGDDDASTAMSPLAAGALLGIHAVGALVGAPAHAAVPDTTTTADLDAALAALEAEGLSDTELAERRAALWTAYVDAGGAETVDTDTVTLTAEHDFEARWAEAKKNSVGPDEVQLALTELGDEATAEKLFTILDGFEKKLSPSGEAELHAAIATVQVSEAAKDGTVSVEDLTTVETTLASQVGEAEARRAIVRSLGEVFDKLDVDAKTHVLERASTIEAHTDRLQSIVDEMLEGKQTLIDINGDGKLDVGDLVFHANDEGKITVERINKKLADRATVAAAIVDASYAMNDAGVGFELIKDHRVNDEFWKVGAGGVMTLKPGVKPSDAVRDIIENGDEYGFECATGLVATYYVAMLDLLGPADFDRVADDVRMGPWKMDNDMRRLLVTSNPNPGSTYDELGDHALEPGFYYYFKNWDVTDDARERGWQGENVIYLGDGKFYGHGIGLGDADLFINKLASEMEEDGKTPSLLNLHAWIDTDILDLDTHPGQ